ncbi:MAG: FAD:protein FMN transferase [Verrucomicrobiae bacterium]|nr:FAD:protein FMN transferase [Verrucomicrobiae bacterium]
MISLKKFWCASRGLSRPLICFFGFWASACHPGPREDYIKGDTMGTFYAIHFMDEKVVRAKLLTTKVEALLRAFENELSNWQPNSWINRFNALPAGESIAVPDHAFEVLTLCLDFADKSEGMLDPTVSPLIELWGFGTRRQQRIPEDHEIREQLSRVGYEKLSLDVEKPLISKTVSGLQLNCSAVAKGYAVDLVANLLAGEGIENFLINIGGEVRAAGTRPDGSPWKVAVHGPSANGRDGDTYQTVSLTDRSMATSGHSQRSFIMDGRRYTHILNPKTGYPVSADIASASVLAPSCALADGLATLALILDEEQMDALLGHFEGVEVFRTAWSEDYLTLHR